MKTIPIGVLHTGGYGAAELSKFYPRSMSRSLVLSIMLQVALIATFDVFREPEGTYVRPEHRPPHTPVGPIPIPISFNGDAPFGISRPVGHAAGLKFAIPVPVPVEDTASRDLTPSSPYEGGGFGTGGDAPTGGVWNGDGIQPGEEITEPSIFTPYERPPEVVKRVEAKYPVLAVRSGVEGTVTVNVFVSKTGKVRKAIILASTADILNDAATEAAVQWVFTPALMNRNPVAVWVSIPFRFRLQRI